MTPKPFFFSRFKGGSGKPKDLSSWWVLAAFALVFLFSLGLRMFEYPAWCSPEFTVSGEKLMATHDAYAWLAGAKGTSRYATAPLSRFVAFLNSVTGLSLGTIGFWLPVFFAPLAALPLCILAGRLGRPEAGLAAGLAAASSIGFFVRTRLGFLDTDVLTLFFATASGSWFLLWLSPACRKTWPPQKEYPERGGFALSRFWAGAALLGMFLRFYTVYYYSSGRPIVWGLYLMSGAVGLVLAKPGNRMPVLMGLALVLGVWIYGLPALAVAVLIAGIAFFQPEAFQRHRLGLILAGVFLALLFLVQGWRDMAAYTGLVGQYLKLSPVQETAVTAPSALRLPSVIQSVREAATLPFLNVMDLIAGHWTLFILAMAGYAFLVWKRPLFLVWLPLLGLGIACFKLGTRFSMYAGPVAGLGLGFGLSEILSLITRSRLKSWLAQAVLCGIVALPLLGAAKAFKPFPVMPKAYAQTLIDLKDMASDRAVLWQWWDYGYAAQYYAERDTFGDGGRHSGEFLYPLALAHITSSPMRAAQVIKLVAQGAMEYEQELIAQGTRPYPPARIPFYPDDPLRALDGLGPEKSKALINDLGRTPKEWKKDIPEQYFIVSWENLRLGGWISRYGNWDLATGQTVRGKISPITGETHFDVKRGIMQTQRAPAPLTEMRVFSGQGPGRQYFWPRFDGYYALTDRQTRQVFLMEQSVYESMMVRMLVGEPEDFEPYFTLKVDRGPYCRAYVVN
ncbi:MAG: STT3 domain-containing protein [Thermodesulfobacteriota bacterium]|nr:STT3 domain-containing protein [Thermodesulfobacteriota bacterium]